MRVMFINLREENYKQRKGKEKKKTNKQNELCDLELEMFL